MPGKNLVVLAAVVAAATFACGDDATEDSPALRDDPMPSRKPAKSTPVVYPIDGATVLDPVDSGAPPAVEIPAPACKLDTRAVYIQDGRTIESITAYGRYWSRELHADGASTEADDFPRAVATEPKFSNGPCAGRASCILDSRVIWFDGGAKIESTTAYGASWAWSFDPLGAPIARPGFPQALAATAVFHDGPCSFAGGAACTFDTRTIEPTPAGRVETVTAYGRWYEWLVSPGGSRVARAGNGSSLTTLTRLASGACKGQAPGSCVLDTRTVYTSLDGARTEEVTARGRLWVYRLAANGDLLATSVDGTPLVEIPRLAGPCAH